MDCSDLRELGAHELFVATVNQAVTLERLSDAASLGFCRRATATVRVLPLQMRSCPIHRQWRNPVCGPTVSPCDWGRRELDVIDNAHPSAAVDIQRRALARKLAAPETVLS
jgi:hypothetical protein